jgi:hypothetical protein
MEQNLMQRSAPLEGIGEMQTMRTPNDMAWKGIRVHRSLAKEK